MTEMILIWLVAPLAFFFICYGVGLSISLITRRPMNSAVVASSGLLLITIIGSVSSGFSSTAKYSAWIIGAIAATCLIGAAIWFRPYFRFDRQASLAGLITYILFSLPVMAYGKPSWAGWVQLDDNSSWYAISDRLMNIGNSVPNPIATTYDRVIEIYMSGNGFNYGGVNNGLYSYPLGAYVPFGVMSKLTNVELAWLFQPFLSICAALAAMLFVIILRKRISNKYFLVGIASFSTMASLMYSYVMWGGIKEIMILVPVTLLALTLIRSMEKGAGKDLLIYPLIAILGFIFIGGKASVGLMAPIIIVAILLKISLINRQWFIYLISGGGLVAVGAAFYLGTGNSLGKLLVPEIRDNGNLYGPLNLLQGMGIWPAKDFRLIPMAVPVTYAVIFLVIGFAIYGIYASVRRGMWVIPSMVFSCVAVVVYSNIWGGVWLTGKALAVASPIFLLAASVGAYELWNRANRARRNLVGWERVPWLQSSLILVVVAGVLFSDVLTYRNTWLAPYPQLSELQEINKKYAGQGPTLMTEYSPYGARYFLKDMATESASELRVHTIPLRDGSQLPKGAAADIDLFANSSIDFFNLLVLRKAGNSSRPPLNYSLEWSGKSYDVWKKNDTKLTIKSTFPIGNNFTPAATPTCPEVVQFLKGRKSGDQVYTVERAPTLMVDFSTGDLPPNWLPIAAPNGGVQRSGPGAFSREFAVNGAGDYSFWLAGSYPGRLQVQVDGLEIFSGSQIYEGNSSLTNPLSTTHLAFGRHVLTLIYQTPWYMPGSAVNYQFGPIYLSTQTAGTSKVEKVSRAGLANLCKRNLDWIALAN